MIGHGALTASGGLVLILGAAGVPMDVVLVNANGVSGMIVLAVVVLTLFFTDQYKREPQLATKSD